MASRRKEQTIGPMSYARFSDTCDVQVIFSKASATLECVDCRLLADGSQFAATTFRTTQEMLAHLATHEEVNDRVPESTYNKLAEDRAQNDSARPEPF